MDIYNLRKRIFEIIEKGDKNDSQSRYFDIFIMGLIILSVSSIIVESFDSAVTKYGIYLNRFEIFSIIIFSIEYMLRIFTADFACPSSSKFKSFLLYITSPMAIIDLLAILPMYLPMLIAVDLRILRILRLTRLLRVFKLNRYTHSLSILNRVLKKEKDQLIVTIFITSLLLLIASSIMYYLEHDIQPESFPNIISSLWWAIATLTTVGYGDIYPVTALGRMLSGVIAILGIGLVAMPTGIISAGFLSEIDKTPDEDKKRIGTIEHTVEIKCPHCGTHIIHQRIKE
jgi:voltage-gated potassium channel